MNVCWANISLYKLYFCSSSYFFPTCQTLSLLSQRGAVLGQFTLQLSVQHPGEHPRGPLAIKVWCAWSSVLLSLTFCMDALAPSGCMNSQCCVCVLKEILDVSVHAFVLRLMVCACAYMYVCLSANSSLTLPRSHLCVPPPPSNIWDHGMGSGDDTPDETDTEVWHKLMLLHLCLKTRHIFNTVFEGSLAKPNKAHIHTGYYQVSREKSSQILISKFEVRCMFGCESLNDKQQNGQSCVNSKVSRMSVLLISQGACFIP